MRVFFPTLCEHLRQGRNLALATIIEQQGSAPRGSGSRMLAHAQGLAAGTVGGGLVEAHTLEACARCLAAEQGRILHFDLSGEMAAQTEMICGGHLQVLVEVILPSSLPFWEDVLQALHHEGGILLTPLHQGIPAAPALLVGERWYGAAPAFTLPAEAQHLTTSKVLCCGQHSCVVQPLLPPLRLIVAGGGHVSRPTAHIAALAGYEVLVLDDRPEFADARRFPEARTQLACAEFARCFEDLPFMPGPRTAIVIVTRGHLYDAAVLAQALATNAGYIGMIGSTRKRDSVYASLRSQGCTDADLARVHCPVGLPIQAETPEEIAVSIVAQCIQHFATQGSRLRAKARP